METKIPGLSPAFASEFQKGMSTRLFVATMIMQGLMTNPDSDEYYIGNGKKTTSTENKVKLCYQLADELLNQEQK